MRGRPLGGGEGGEGAFRPRIRLRRSLGVAFAALCLAATLVGIVALVVLLFDVWRDGADAVSWRFVTSFPSRFASRAGIEPALVGSLWILALTGAFSFPIGVGTAIWLEEYAPRSRLTRLIQVNIANLAGVPAISVPCGLADGLPVGLQIIGKAFDETTVLRAAYAYEQSTEHHKLRAQL